LRCRPSPPGRSSWRSAGFLLYLQRFFDPLQDLSQFYNTFQSAGAALEKISGVLDEAPRVPEPEAPAELPARSSAGRELQLRSVRFGYRETIVLPDLDVRIAAGQTATTPTWASAAAGCPRASASSSRSHESSSRPRPCSC
jgi:hypothetical protein